jgi:hypothetical protein
VSHAKDVLDQTRLRGIDDVRRGGRIAGNRELRADHDGDAGSRAQANSGIAGLQATDDGPIDAYGTRHCGLTCAASHPQVADGLTEPSSRPSKLSVGLPDREPA